MTQVLNDAEISQVSSNPLQRLLRAIDSLLGNRRSTAIYTPVGNITTGEDDLMSTALAANTLDENGKGVRITCWGVAANNSNAKTLKLYFGHVIITTALTVSQVGTWRVVAEVIRTAAGAQRYAAHLCNAGTAVINDVEQGTLTEDETAAITIKMTGDATSTDDLIQNGMIIQPL